MNAEQLELTAQPGPPPVAASEVDLLIARLRGRDWRTAADLGAMHENDKRKLRAVCRQSHGLIISGPKGYKLTSEVSADDYARCRARFQAIADDIGTHLAELDAQFYRNEGVQP